jgi:predicted CDP-diglyceride synthetase/phosphatidate cytidylyltransferase
MIFMFLSSLQDYLKIHKITANYVFFGMSYFHMFIYIFYFPLFLLISIKNFFHVYTKVFNKQMEQIYQFWHIKLKHLNFLNLLIQKNHDYLLKI